LVVVLFALTGCGGQGGQPNDAAPSSTSATTTTTANPPASAYAPFSIFRTGNGFRLAGDLPDESTKASFVDALRSALPGAEIVDDFKVVPGAQAPDLAALGGVFSTAVEITGFGLKLERGVITLTGTAASEDVKAAAESTAATEWPNVKVVNDIRVDASTTTTPPR
jgi:hypothetical protein